MSYDILLQHAGHKIYHLKLRLKSSVGLGRLQGSLRMMTPLRVAPWTDTLHIYLEILSVSSPITQSLFLTTSALGWLTGQRGAEGNATAGTLGEALWLSLAI